LPFTKDSKCSGCVSGNTDSSTLEQTIISEAKDNQINQTTASVVTEQRVSQRNIKVNKERPGSIMLNKAPPGCRFERENEINPKSNKFSHNLRLQLSANNLNCLGGNTLNTIYALGHHMLLGESKMEAYKSPTTSNDLHFTTVVNELSNDLHYSIALSKLMTKDNSPKLNELAKIINSAKVPMLIVLNITYSGGQLRKHLIGIVPSVMIDNKSEMHIVDGYNTDRKSVPFNEENVKWCCSGCTSYFIEQFVLFTPGKKCLSNLSKVQPDKTTPDKTTTPQIYKTIKTRDELLGFIPSNYQSKKRKRGL
jgi:hypothetical protein